MSLCFICHQYMEHSTKRESISLRTVEWVNECDAAYVCRNHLFFHAFTCGPCLFRYSAPTEMQRHIFYGMRAKSIFHLDLCSFLSYLKSAPLHQTRSDFIILRCCCRRFFFLRLTQLTLSFFQQNRNIIAMHRCTVESAKLPTKKCKFICFVAFLFAWLIFSCHWHRVCSIRRAKREGCLRCVSPKERIAHHLPARLLSCRWHPRLAKWKTYNSNYIKMTGIK